MSLLPVTKNGWAAFFSYYRLSQTSQNNLKGPGRSYDILNASYKINSSGPKKLIEPMFSEKGSRHGEENYLTCFCHNRNIEDIE